MLAISVRSLLRENCVWVVWRTHAGGGQCADF